MELYEFEKCPLQKSDSSAGFCSSSYSKMLLSHFLWVGNQTLPDNIDLL